MFGLFARLSILALAINLGINSSYAAPKINPGEMKNAVAASNTAFKRCVTQTQLHEKGVSKLSRQDINTAKKVARAEDQLLATRLNPSVPAAAASNGRFGAANLGSLLGNSQPQTVQQGLIFSLGNGYAADVQSWLQPFNAGDPLRAAALLAHESPSKMIQRRKYRKDPTLLADQTVADKIGVLGLVERATVSLAGGDLECSVNFLDLGIRKSDLQQGSFWGADLEQYEHIMAVNLKSAGYLLAGDERARNMAQSSRELQARARDLYREALAEEQQKAEQQSASGQLPNQLAWMELFEAAFQNSSISNNGQIAERMTSPYVNPLADYLSAVIAETEAAAGTGTLDEWSRASIAWRNAYELAPNSAFLNEASAQTDTWQRGSPPAGQKIVNVLIANGSAPTDAVAKMYFNYQGSPFPVMMPVKVSQENSFNGGTISAGAQSASFEIVSDIEGMVMRGAEDRRGGEMLSALVRGWIAFEAGNAIGANSGSVLGNVLGGAVRDTLAEPVTDTWSSLPSSYYAARIVVPDTQNEVTVSLPGVGTETYPLLPDQNTFVFASVKNDKILGMAQRAQFGGGRLEFEVQ